MSEILHSRLHMMGPLLLFDHARTDRHRLHTFVRGGDIETKRGNITICERAGLVTVAGSAYGQPEAE